MDEIVNGEASCFSGAGTQPGTSPSQAYDFAFGASTTDKQRQHIARQFETSRDFSKVKVMRIPPCASEGGTGLCSPPTIP